MHTETVTGLKAMGNNVVILFTSCLKYFNTPTQVDFKNHSDRIWYFI